jgi:membrane-bound metal-dependent hydrolase YbcI (DUF457 family)
VDVVSHLAFGRALVALAYPPPAAGTTPAIRRRALTAAVMVGAIAPDVDAVLMPFGWDRYLLWHERGTHTMLGAVLVAALLASVIRYVIQPLIGRAPAQRTPWRALWLAAFAGCLSHLLLDVVCGGWLHLLWPLSDVRMASGLVAMADPLLAVPLVLFVVIAAIWRRRAFELALALLLVMMLALVAKAVSRTLAFQAYTRDIETHAIERPIRTPGVPVPIEARWASLTDWYIFDRTPSQVRAWLIDVRGGGTVRPYVEHSTRPPDSLRAERLIEDSLELDTVKHALSLFDLTFPDVVDREDGTADVLWSDIRFCRPSMCDLRFGGRFDHAGRALEQLVVIGTVRQTRPVPHAD